MAELKKILDLWKRASAAGEDVCLATVVGVEGSAYRRPGARMLLTSSGLRAGTISGGCLEAEVAKKAWWLTANGSSIQRYSSFFDDDGDLPYGLGCGGTVLVLLERGAGAAQTLEALRRSVEERTASVAISSMETDAPGTALILNDAGEVVFDRRGNDGLSAIGREALDARESRRIEGYFVEFIAPPPALFVFGAGDDAQPLVEFGATLGWHVTVADGRSQLARRDRFPLAARVEGPEQILTVGSDDAAVIMTHSYEQDRKLLSLLLPQPTRYLGILGPKRRTERLAGEVGPPLGLSVAEVMSRLHTPVGLDLGGHSPAAIALSIAAELQAVFAGKPVRRIDAAPPVHA